MKSIEYCLDELLRQLKANWRASERSFLEADKFLQEMGYPKNHEFFISLIDKLINDGYAKLSPTEVKMEQVDLYQQKTIITIDGYYFVHKGKSYRCLLVKSQIMEIGKRVVTILGAVGAVVAITFGIINIYKFYHCICNY